MENTKEEFTKEPKEVFVLRKVRAPARYLPDGRYDKKPLSPTYVKEYYARQRGDCQCPHCSKKFEHPDVLRQHIRRSKRCINLRETLQLKAALEAAGIATLENA